MKEIVFMKEREKNISKNFLRFYNFFNMIQNCLTESVTKNYKAPNYPIYIAIHNSINSINNKKSMKDAKSDVAMVRSFLNLAGSKIGLRRRKVCSSNPLQNDQL